MCAKLWHRRHEPPAHLRERGSLLASCQQLHSTWARLAYILARAYSPADGRLVCTSVRTNMRSSAVSIPRSVTRGSATRRRRVWCVLAAAMVVAPLVAAVRVQAVDALSSANVLGLEVSATRLRVVEGGSAASYTVGPATDPGQTLTIAIGNPDSTAFTVSPSTLSFTSGSSGNWNTPRQVTITPKQDADSEHEIVGLTHTASGHAAGIAEIDVQVYVEDDEASEAPPLPDDAGGFYGTFSQVSKPMVKMWEQPTWNTGSEHTYQIRLTSDPGQDVTLNALNPLPGLAGLTISPASVTFTAGAQGNWNTYQTVTVLATPDSDGNDTLLPLYFIHSTGAFVGPPVLVHVRDIQGKPGVANKVVFGVEYPEVTERGASLTYSVRMSGQPTNYLRMHLSSTVPKSVTVSPAIIDFDRSNYDDPQYVTVTARDDLDSLTQTGFITHRYQESTHSDWDNANHFTPGHSLPLKVFDTWHAELIIEQQSEKIANAITYDGKDPSYTVRLAADPGQVVTIDLEHNDRVIAHPQQLTFTGGAGGDWSTPQTVTLQVPLDPDTANEDIVIDHVYDGFVEAAVPVSIIDSDPKSVIVYVYPDYQHMNEGEAVQSYFVALADDPGGEVNMTLTSSLPESLTASPSTLTFDSDTTTCDSPSLSLLLKMRMRTTTRSLSRTV